MTHINSSVVITDVTKTYGKSVSVVHALRNVSLQVQSGERVALLGKSGSGKSTLLNLIAGLDRPTSGNIKVAECELSTMSSAEIAQYRLMTVGVIFQSYNLIASRTALQNVELPMLFAGCLPRERRREAQSALEVVGLADRIRHYPAELSGGEQQRVAIARALMNQPQLLLADEPTGNLDSKTSEEIMDLIMKHSEDRGTTVILVTHDEDLAQDFSNRVLHIQDGSLINS